MGRSSKPTIIAIASQFSSWDEIKALEAQGHEVRVMSTWLEGVDLILAPNAWRMSPELRPYLLSHTLPEARRLSDLRRKKGDPPVAPIQEAPDHP